MFKYLLLALIPAFVAAQEQCANGAPLPTGVRMEGCPTFDCGLTIGAVHTFEVDFDVPAASSTMTATIEAFLPDGTPVPYDLPAEAADGCANLIAGSCPVGAGDSVTFRLSMPLDYTEAIDVVDIEANMVADDGSSLVCFRVTTTIRE